jgi:hypothetical protein
MSLIRFPVSVVMECVPLASRWASAQWRPASVALADARDAGKDAETIDGGDGIERWRWHGLVVELAPSEGEGYYLNLTSPEAVAFVMWRLDEAEDPRAKPVLVTLSYNEAARILDGGERVDPVPMPAELRNALETFTAAHYRPEPRRKQRRRDPLRDDERGTEPR